MNEADFDRNPLLNPPKEPSAKVVIIIDRLSWTLPVCAALFSVGGGVAAFQGIDKPAAILGVLGGLASAAGVVFTGWASRIRDGRLEVAHALGGLGVDIAQQTQSMFPPNL
jgi:hypothetical protein